MWSILFYKTQENSFIKQSFYFLLNKQLNIFMCILQRKYQLMNKCLDPFSRLQCCGNADLDRFNINMSIGR